MACTQVLRYIEVSKFDACTGPPTTPGPSVTGNTQQFILERAERTVAEGTPAALQAYVADLRELLEKRRDALHMVQVSSCIHRLGRVVNSVSQACSQPSHFSGRHLVTAYYISPRQSKFQSNQRCPLHLLGSSALAIVKGY